MGDLESKRIAADLLSATLKRKRLPAKWHLWLGVVFPFAVIAFEVGARWCAQAFLDPLPTIGHGLAVAAVPASNFLIWRSLRGGLAVDPSRLALASGFAIGVATIYSLLFLPLLPLAFVAMLFFGLGLLPFAPLASLISALKLSSALRQKQPEQQLWRPIATGIASAVALLIALDIPAAMTLLGAQRAASADAAERQRGLWLIRTLGDEDQLLRLCYDTSVRPSGLLTAAVTLSTGERQVGLSTDKAREIYYRAFGVP